MKKPIVAIIGRPNVGKSTLFNRIIRRREAIVDDTPGLTRDRKQAAAEWAGVEFDLLDTGGYVPFSDDVFERAIRRQVELALNEADLAVLLCDVTDGVTPLDLEIAEMVRRSGVSSLVAVNKVDNEKREADVAEFFQLGLGEPSAISAMAGRAIGDFLDRVVHLLPQRAAAAEELPEMRLAIVGRPNVGKSSLVNALLGQEKMIVTEIAGTTRDAVDSILRYYGRSIVLVDTAGLRKRSRIKEDIEYFSTLRTAEALRRCDVAVVLVDAVEGLTDQDKSIIGNALSLGKGVVVAVNKWDLVEKDTNTARHFEMTMREELRDLRFLPILFISAVTKQRIFKVIDVALSVHQERQKRLATGDLNRCLQDAVAENHPPAYGSKWIKINYATQVKSAPPTFIFFTNEPRGIKSNYRHYLENKLRERFGFFGVPIRMVFRKKNK
ncbi:MAG: ribosome biogenesis GTPase Der [candidate division KSB1 bacterium]|nr:ribosome biogenesis GTPase Der [candidate division KSB1 bacterium]MDZ7345538.1 ribosome biogenesis GTPase Der [candidate division KSB1 bacterium]